MRCVELDDDEFAQFYRDHTNKQTADYYNIGLCTVKRWARKLNLPRKNVIRNDYVGAALSPRQIDVISGCMLGDGCLSKTTLTTNSSLFVGHGGAQKDWSCWKCDVFSPFSRPVFDKESVGRVRLKSGQVISDYTKSYISHRFYTIKHEVFTKFEKKWYKRDMDGGYVFNVRHQRIKIVPADFVLTKLALAVWFIDDGYNKVSSGRHEIYALSFDPKELDRLLEDMRRLGLMNCHRECYHRGGFFIVVDKGSYSDLIDLVQEQIPDLPAKMLYKVRAKKGGRYGRSGV